jgi:hypothetical protein
MPWEYIDLHSFQLSVKHSKLRRLNSATKDIGGTGHTEVDRDAFDTL